MKTLEAAGDASTAGDGSDFGNTPPTKKTPTIELLAAVTTITPPPPPTDPSAPIDTPANHVNQEVIDLDLTLRSTANITGNAISSESHNPISVSGINRTPMLLNLFSSENPHKTMMISEPSTNLQTPFLVPVDNQQNVRLNMGTDMFRRTHTLSPLSFTDFVNANVAGSSSVAHQAGPSSQPPVASVLAIPYRTHTDLGQAQQFGAPPGYPKPIYADPIRFVPPAPQPTVTFPQPQGGYKNDQNSPDLTPQQLYLLNQLALQAYPVPRTQPISFLSRPMGGIKKPNGVMFRPMTKSTSDHLSKKQAVKDKRPEKMISATEFNTWKLYQDRLKRVAVAEAERNAYAQLWGNIVGLQKQCMEYNDKVRSMSSLLEGKDEQIANLNSKIDLNLSSQRGEIGTVERGEVSGATNEAATVIDHTEMLEAFEQEHGWKDEKKTDNDGGKHPTPRE